MTRSGEGNAMRLVGALVGAAGCLAAGIGPGHAACSNERANALAQQFGAMVQLKMAAKADEMGDLASRFGDVMSAATGGVTDQTCVDLERLVREARAL